MPDNDTPLPWTDLTLEEARAKLGRWHLMKEQLSPEGQEILYIAEGLLRLADPGSYSQSGQAATGRRAE